ncbi:MAG: hypothetical protein HOH89_08630 [Alphaproteobacteria bacterium]|jgi:hypothetical protein|nr:hypothetical protein [Alphaproteobacteria bacterium]
MRDPRAIGIAVAVIAVAGVWWMASAKESVQDYAAFDADALRVSDLAGSLHIEVTDDSTISVTAHGPSDALKRLDIGTRDGTLVIDQDRGLGWIRIFGLRDRDMDVTVRIPKGIPVSIDDLTGELFVGDISAPIDVDGHITGGQVGDVTSAAVALNGSSNLKFGKVSGALVLRLSGSGRASVESANTAAITVSGSGNFSIGDVAENLALSLRGSAVATAGSAQSAALSISGSGKLQVAEVRSGLALNIRGSGVGAIGSLNGPAEIAISGSGSATIEDGRAGPFVAEIHGSGRLDFGGIAIDPMLTVTGSGRIVVATHQGTLIADGDNIVVNGERVANR